MTLSRRSLMSGLMLIAVPNGLAAAQVKSTEIRDLQERVAKAIQGGGQLELPAGEIVASGITINGGVSISGVAGRTRLVSPDGEPVFTIRTNEPVNLRGLTFTGEKISEDVALIMAEDATALSIADCRFAGTKGSAIWLEKSGGHITGNDFSAIGKNAIFSRDAKGLLISQNSIADIGNNAIQVWTSVQAEDGTIISNNRIAHVAYADGGTGQNGNGVMIFRAGNVIVEGNRITDCAFTGVRNNSGSNCQIVDNNISRMGEVAIYCEFAFDGAVVSGNIIEDTGLGISITNLDKDGHLATVANNIVRRCRGPGTLKETTGTGIHTEGDAAVTGNVVEDARDSGISLGWGPYSRTLLATGNIVRNAKTGISFSMTQGADAVLIANNRITGSKGASIAGFDHTDQVTEDLGLPDAEIPPGMLIRDNLVS